MIALVPPLAWAKRTDDVIIMRNGDWMTGEIKKLEDGQLHFKAAYMLSSVALDWRLVERVVSKDHFNVSLTNGQIYSGVIGMESPREPSRDFFILEGGAAVHVAGRDVAAITPVENSVWKQLTGSMDYGYSYTGGNNATTQSSLGGSLGYRAERWSIGLDGSSVFNSQSEGTSTGRNTASFLYIRYLSQKWYAGALTEFLNSRQQALTLRATMGGGLGRYLIRTDRSGLGVLAGLSVSRERYSDESGPQPRVNNAEALFRVTYEMFRFKTADVDAVLYAFPSLTDLGRVRMGVQSALRFELFRNFFWKFSIYENFDSRPPVHAPRNDFGTGTSVGWTF
jgi:putative salt-induced outer membrane protein YdiY